MAEAPTKKADIADEVWDTIGPVIEAWKPPTEKKRSGKNYFVGNECVFEFARMLKGISGFEALEPEYRRDVVRVWWETHKDTILEQPDGPQTLDEAQLCFDAAWPKAKYPPGQIEKVIMERARAEQPPEADQFDDPVIRLLVSICYHLQDLSGSEPFYLAGSMAARLCGRTQPWAARMLRGLVERGILKIEKEGTAKKAIRYRYIAQDKDTIFGIEGPDPELTRRLIKLYRNVGNNQMYKPDAKDMPKFISATEKILAYAERVHIPISDLVKVLRRCMERHYTEYGEALYPGHLCSNTTWDKLVPQHLRELGYIE